MGLGWRVALERELPGVDAAAVDGKALIHAQHELEEIAARLGLEPLTAFLSVRQSEVAAYLEKEGLNPDDFPIPDEEWFPPADGLKTVRGLLDHLRAAPDAVTNGRRVTQDLQAIEAILLIAEREQVPFHLATSLPQL